MMTHALPQTSPASAYVPQPPIADYAIIGDCRTAALISRDGAIDWLCLPNYASPSIFAHILSPGRGGRFSIQPREAFVSRRKYRDLQHGLSIRSCTAGGGYRKKNSPTSRVIAMRELLGQSFVRVRRKAAAAVDRHCWPHRAEKLHQRSLEQPRLEVPECHVHRGNGRRADPTPAEIAHAPHHRFP